MVNVQLCFWFRVWRHCACRNDFYICHRRAAFKSKAFVSKKGGKQSKLKLQRCLQLIESLLKKSVNHSQICQRRQNILFLGCLLEIWSAFRIEGRFESQNVEQRWLWARARFYLQGKSLECFCRPPNCTNHGGRIAFKSTLTRSGALASLWNCWSWNKHISSQEK